MRALLSLILLAATSAGAAIDLPREKEKWVTTHVDDFAIFSNATERDTIEVMENLLRMRDVVARITKMRVRSGVPTHVYLFRNERSFAPYRDAVMQRANANFTGVYLSREDVNFILLQADSQAGIDRVVYHELTHAFVRNTAPGLPLWFNEGIAEYYSAFATRGNKVEIGRPITEHVLWLREKKLIPLGELFAVDADSAIYDESSRQGVFYAQSWALVHYLLTGNAERREQLPKFLTLIGTRRPAEEILRTAFGVGVKEMEAELRKYVQQRLFTYRSYTLDELKTTDVPAPQPLPRDEVLFRLGDLLARSGDHAVTDAEQHLLEALKLNPQHAGARGDLGLIYDGAGRAAEATAAFEQALRLGPRDATVYLTYGASLLRKGAARRARPLFEKAIALAPASARAWAGLGATYVLDDGDPAAGIAALEKSMSLAAGQEDVAFGLVQLYAREGRREDAQRLVDAIIAPSGDAAMLRHALQAVSMADYNRAMRLLEQRKEEEAIALLRPLLETTTNAPLKEHIEQLIRSWDEERLVGQQMEAVNAAITLANAGKRAEALLALDKAIPEIRNAELLKYAQEVREGLAKKRK